MINTIFNRDTVSLFSQLEQGLVRIQQSLAPFQPFAIVEAVQFVVQANTNFADVHLKAEMADVRRKAFLLDLSRFYSLIGPLKKAFHIPRWISILGFASDRFLVKSQEIRSKLADFIDRGESIVQKYFQCYSPRWIELRPDWNCTRRLARRSPPASQS